MTDHRTRNPQTQSKLKLKDSIWRKVLPHPFDCLGVNLRQLFLKSLHNNARNKMFTSCVCNVIMIARLFTFRLTGVLDGVLGIRIKQLVYVFFLN